MYRVSLEYSLGDYRGVELMRPRYKEESGQSLFRSVSTYLGYGIGIFRYLFRSAHYWCSFQHPYSDLVVLSVGPCSSLEYIWQCLKAVLLAQQGEGVQLASNR